MWDFICMKLTIVCHRSRLDFTVLSCLGKNISPFMFKILLEKQRVIFVRIVVAFDVLFACSCCFKSMPLATVLSQYRKMSSKIENAICCAPKVPYLDLY